MSAVDADDVLDEHVDGGRLVADLLEDLEGLLVQADLDAHARDLLGVVAVEAVDVVHDAGLVGLGGGEDEQVLQVLVVAEGRRLQHDLLEQLDQLGGQVGVEEARDGLGHLGRVGGLGHGAVAMTWSTTERRWMLFSLSTNIHSSRSARASK